MKLYNPTTKQYAIYDGKYWVALFVYDGKQYAHSYKSINTVLMLGYTIQK